MKKRVRFVWLMAILTITGIILFQVYWVYNSYKTEERNFYRSVTFSLERSINAYLLGEINPYAAFNPNSSSISMINGSVKIPRPNNSVPGTGTVGQGIVIKFTTSQAPSPSASQLKLVMANLVAATLVARNSNEPLKMDALSSILKNELQKNNLPVSFKLHLLKKQKMLPANQAAAFVISSRDNDAVVADIINVNQYLLPRIFIPALISLLLIFFSAASLFYMGIIIRKQMRLDSMKNDFFSNIAHELRTPISILKSTHEALYKFGESSNPEITSRYLQINTTILDKLDGNVDRILDIAGYEHGAKPSKIERVDLVTLFKEITTEFMIYKQASIQYDLPARPYVDTDRYIIVTVLTSLVDNAIKYAGRPVNIRIMAWFEDRDWKLEVKDDGQGIDEQYQPYIFDKFYRVPSGDIHEVKGYGLGLNYVKGLVAILNGRISVKSSKGIGTTFTVKLPLYG
ncbi:HAMP domain-containing sensor histidine kinase [Pedobacter nutrimenti]|uniref:sensor histidine kinase n=1 Tax=Pedobacter nutrimenti TaxID=1241337 RepID=UPI00292E1576|nr:HAMP domain-containing sensor histidine kinase [Pedobacter nutrimenti]